MAADEEQSKKIAKALNILVTRIPLDDLLFIAGKANKNADKLVSLLHKAQGTLNLLIK